jgi:hypothetical protein
MPIEVANYVQDLDVSNPPGSDDRSQGDNHLRLIKTALKGTFPNSSKAFRFPSSGATKTASFSVTFPTDQNVAFAIDSSAGAVVVTLPDPTSGGTVHEDGFGFWLILTAGTNAVTVTPAGAQTIMGAASYSMPAIRQYAYLFWAGTQDRWLVFEGNNPALTYGLQLVTASETALIVRRTENVLDTEYTLASWRLGSGAGAVAADTYVSGGANDVKERRRYIGATEIERLTTSLALFNITFGVGASLRLNSSGYIEATEIAAPAAPAANVMRMYAKDVSGTTRFAVRDSADVEVLLLPIPARAYDDYDANADLTTIIPFDDSIPQQSTEGTKILEASITLSSAASRVRVRFQGWGVGFSGSESRRWVAALFLGATEDALAVVMSGLATDGIPNSASAATLEFEHAPGSVGPHTYKIHVGGASGHTVRMNGFSSARFFGGASKSTLVVEEVLV